MGSGKYEFVPSSDGLEFLLLGEGCDPTVSLMMDIGYALKMQEATRRFEGWHNYHRQPLGGNVEREVLVIDRYDPKIGKYARVVATTTEFHPKGRLVTSEDFFISTVHGRFNHAKATLLILPHMKNWPLGSTCPAIVRASEDGINLISGHRYNHFPMLNPIDSNDWITLRALGRLEHIVSSLTEGSYEPFQSVGTGEF